MARRKHHHVYVGMTGLDPDVRFDWHKARIDLRSAGFGVWQA